jgi:hypothetical protein
MGYKWNAWDTIEDFIKKINMGYGTGTGGYANYKEYPYQCVTGISCTGLVSRAWHLKKKYTLNYDDPKIKRKFNKISYTIVDENLQPENVKLRKGDALLNDNHIMLFIYETRDGYPMIIDSRFWGVKFRKTTWEELINENYQPIRYNKIIDDPKPIGTIKNPYKVNLSKNNLFIHKGNTRDVVSMEFDHYNSLNSNNVQSGPEFIYEIANKSYRNISISITDFKEEGINNDIFLLKSLKRDNQNIANDMLAYADTYLTYNLFPGIYYLIVDSGKDKPGEYYLYININNK